MINNFEQIQNIYLPTKRKIQRFTYNIETYKRLINNIFTKNEIVGEFSIQTTSVYISLCDGKKFI